MSILREEFIKMFTLYVSLIILCCFFSFPELPFFFHAVMFVALQSVNRNPYSLPDFFFFFADVKCCMHC